MTTPESNERRPPTPEEATRLLRIQDEGATDDDIAWCKAMEKVWVFKFAGPVYSIYGVTE